MFRLAILRGVIWVGLLSGSVLLLLGYFGALHPAGDSFAVFRLELSVLLGAAALVGLILGVGRIAAFGMALALSAALPILWGMRDQPGDGVITLYQKNLLWVNPTLDRVEGDIRATDPDVITLQELSAANMPLLDALRDRYPHQAVCATGPAGRLAVLSRWPALEDDSEVCASGMAALHLDTPHGPIWFVALHLHWPWPYGQAEQVTDLLPVLDGLEGDVVLGGDFNMVPWGSSVRQIGQAANARRIGAISQTLRLGRYDFPRLTIDHVMLPVGWTGGVTLRDALGSDHAGLLARIAPDRQ